MEKTNIDLADSWSAVVDMPVEFRWGSYYAGITNTAPGVRGIVGGTRDVAKSKRGLSGTAKRGKGVWDVLTGPNAILGGVGQVRDSFSGPCEEGCTLGGQAHEYVRGVVPDVNGIIGRINRELSPHGTPPIPSVPGSSILQW